MDFFAFERAVLRLKEAVGVQTDKDVASLLNLDVSAFNKRKTRGSFPEKELRAFAEAHSELNIDVRYILSGQDTQATLAGIPARLREVRGEQSIDAIAQKVGVEPNEWQAVESGTQAVTPTFIKKVIESIDAPWFLITGEREQLAGKLSEIELVLIENYRNSSVEGQKALSHMAAFFAGQKEGENHAEL